MSPKTIDIEDIDPAWEKRLRPVDQDEAALIAASIEEKGLIQPIVVRLAVLADESEKKYILVVGGHRFWAFEYLGWTELVVGESVIIRESDPLSARIDEIDENLARHDLNALDRAIFFAERKKLYDQRRGETRGGNRKDQRFKEAIKSVNFTLLNSPRFTEEAAKRTGWSKATVEKACALAKALDREAIAAIRGTMIEDNSVELLALSKLEPAQQRVVAGFIKAGTARNILQAKWAAGIEKEPSDDPQARILDTLLDGFEKASKPTRAQFMEMAGLAWRKDGDGK
jgi:ParB family chromosome partitioning protein